MQAVVDASFAVAPGEIVGLVGESGCGKSTLARAAVGLVAAARRARSCSTAASSRRSARRARARHARGCRWSSRTRTPRSTRAVASGRRSPTALRRSRAPTAATGDAGVDELLEQVGLRRERRARYPHEFSGGQRQRIAIARALAADPLGASSLDEPLSSLDASAQAQIANLLVGSRATSDVGLLLISHDLGIVRHIADRVASCTSARSSRSGPTDEVWERPPHPYTRGADRARSRTPTARGFLPEALPGEVPDPARPPSGCRFHPRCPLVFDRCYTEHPPLERVSEGREAACWLSVERLSQPAG